MATQDIKGGVDLENSVSGSDQEGITTSISAPVDTAGYDRSLTKRQIMMMTFGAGIGTGLWVGTGTALKYAGPGGIAVAYTIVASIVYLQYVSIGEMTAYRPVHGGFIRQFSEYIDPAMGFAGGINFWFEWVMIIPAEITAAISVLKFWPATDVVPIAAYITIFLAVMALANIFPVKFYGHVEYWMSLIKCSAIILMIFFLFIMTSGGIPATNGPIEFRYWKNPGAFHNGMKGLAKAFVQAGFSFGGGEHIAIIAGEAISPRGTIKKTIYPIFWRMFTFFVVNIWLVGMCVPYNDHDLINGAGTLGSPFVIAIERAGVMWLAHIINGFIFLTVISCGITSVYVASRSLTALSDTNLIHPYFGKKDKQGRPYVSLIISTALGGGLCYLNCNSKAAIVYSWFSALVSIAGFINWGCIFVSHIGFRRALKAQGIDHRSLPFIAHFSPYLQYGGLVILTFILGCLFYLSIFPFGAKGSAKSFFASYLAAPLFVFDYVVYKIYYKTKVVNPAEVDFSDARAFDEEDRLKAEQDAQNGDTKQRKSPWVQTLKNLVLG
ncbi:hypothetical protein ACEPPN_003845 [Leptodophora sp. 'Broadleaf-Isolate-01']